LTLPLDPGVGAADAENTPPPATTTTIAVARTPTPVRRPNFLNIVQVLLRLTEIAGGLHPGRQTQVSGRGW
jgi:hypothetical protein